MALNFDDEALLNGMRERDKREEGINENGLLAQSKFHKWATIRRVPLCRAKSGIVPASGGAGSITEREANIKRTNHKIYERATKKEEKEKTKLFSRSVYVRSVRVMDTGFSRIVTIIITIIAVVPAIRKATITNDQQWKEKKKVGERKKVSSFFSAFLNCFQTNDNFPGSVALWHIHAREYSKFDVNLWRNL